MRKKLMVLSMCVLLAIVLSSCGGKLMKGVKEAAGSMSTANEVKDTEKYNSYIALSNYITQWLDNMFTSYFKEFGVDEEIVIKKNFNGFNTFPVLKGHQDDLDKALNYASQKPAYQATDDSVKALVPKMKQLLVTMDDTQNYYKAKSYSDDQFAKGKELHRQIVAQYGEFTDLADTFFAEFVVITAQKKQEDLEALKKDDQLIRYHAMSIVLKSQEIQKVFYAADIDDDNILDLDVNVYIEKYNQLTEHINKFVEYSKDQDRIKKEKISITPVFTLNLEQVKVAATDLKEILEKKDTTINSTTKGKVTTGGKKVPLKEYSKKVSNLTSSYNTMIGLQTTK